MMSEAASIDKQMHTLDYDRALGDLLELDDTITATIHKLKALGVLNDTLILVTADHGHGFDVFGSADTQYLSSQGNDRDKRNAIGVYRESGLSQYTVSNASISYNTGVNFPVNWDPRYTLAQGVAAVPDHRENFKVHKSSPRLPATNITGMPTTDNYVNPKDGEDGYIVNGTLPSNEAQGVHSLTDVPVFAMGPCQELFGGVYGNVDIFFGMANCLGLGRGTDAQGGNTSLGSNGGGKGETASISGTEKRLRNIEGKLWTIFVAWAGVVLWASAGV